MTTNNWLSRLVFTAAATTTFTKFPARMEREIEEAEKRSGISRRAFLGTIIGSTTVLAVDPLKLIEPAAAANALELPDFRRPILSGEIIEIDVPRYHYWRGVPGFKPFILRDNLAILRRRPTRNEIARIRQSVPEAWRNEGVTNYLPSEMYGEWYGLKLLAVG